MDLAFVMPPVAHEGLSFLEFHREPRVAVVGADHPAAQRDAIHVRELFDDPWIVADTPDPVCRDFWLAMDHRDGVPPKLGPATQTMDKFVQLATAGEVVGLAEASVAQAFARPGVRFVPVVDVEPVTMELGWRAGSPNPLADAFVAVAREALGS